MNKQEIEKAIEILNLAHLRVSIRAEYEMLNKVIEELRQQLNNGWIPVSERLPEDGNPVLTCDGHGNMHLINHLKEYPYPFNISSDNPRYYEVIAWQPLPEPYKEAL